MGAVAVEKAEVLQQVAPEEEVVEVDHVQTQAQHRRGPIPRPLVRRHPRRDQIRDQQNRTPALVQAPLVQIQGHHVLISQADDRITTDLAPAGHPRAALTSAETIDHSWTQIVPILVVRHVPTLVEDMLVTNMVRAADLELTTSRVLPWEIGQGMGEIMAQAPVVVVAAQVLGPASRISAMSIAPVVIIDRGMGTVQAQVRDTDMALERTPVMVAAPVGQVVTDLATAPDTILGLGTGHHHHIIS